MTPDADLPRTSTPDIGVTRSHGEPPTVTRDAAAAARDLLTESGVTVGTPINPSPVIDAPPGFVIEKEIGVGGMGVVYLARQVGLNRPVALKLVKPSDRVDAKALIRFLAEAEAVASIRHPNVVEVYQYGEHAGKPYMVLEFCPGGDLTTITKAEQTRNAEWFRRVADLLAKIADGVNAAHTQGIIHRDLKPANVLLTADGTPKVTDFGLAKRGVGSDLTHTGAVMGTPAYMAPEQAGGGTKFVGPEADVWALGVMLYELCSGERPIDTDRPLGQVLAGVANPSMVLLRARLPAVPADLSLIAHKCLDADPRDRYPTASGLANDLRNWLDGKPISARPAGVIEQAVKWARRNKKLAGMGLAVLLTMATATAVSLGIGSYAQEQAASANHAQRTAEEQTEEAMRQKEKVTTALSDLGTANGKLSTTLSALEKSHEQSNRLLAKALLGSIAMENRDGPLTTYERNALWELATLRPSPVGMMAAAEVTTTPEAAAQFRCRGEFLDHAAVGLNFRRRREVDELFADRLRGASSAREVKRDLALGLISAERVTATREIARTLCDGQSQISTGSGREGDLLLRRALEDGLTSLVTQLRAELAADYLVAELRIATNGFTRAMLAKALAEVANRVSVDRAPDVARRATEVLLEPLAERRGNHVSIRVLTEGLVLAAACLPPESGGKLLAEELRIRLDPFERCALAKALAVVAERLPRDQAAAVCGKAAENFGTSLGIAGTKHYDLRRLAEGLAAMSAHLPEGRSAELCEGAVKVLAHAREKVSFSSESHSLAEGFSAVVVYLPANLAAESVLKWLGKTRDTYECILISRTLVETTKRLPPEKTIEVLQTAQDVVKLMFSPAELTNGIATAAERLPPVKAVEVLLEQLKVPSSGRESLAKSLVSVVAHLPPERAVEVLGSLDKATGYQERHWIAKGLASTAKRLPPNKAADVCEKTARQIVTDLKLFKDSLSRGCLSAAWVALISHLPPEEVYELLTVALDRDSGYPELGALATGLAAISEQLPVGTPDKVRSNVAVRLTEAVAETKAGPERIALAGNLSAVLLGLSERSILQHNHYSGVAALTGVSVVHTALRPHPRPLPPHVLVELLKHPFCVKEARRAVLDALEFTYDRQFADLWEFVAFAEKEHPELDLLTPPKRPIK